MRETGNHAFLLKKSYEIAYAIFRIAAKMDEVELAGQLKGAAISLLGSIAKGKYEHASGNAATIEYFVRFAMDMGVIGTANGELLLKEVYGLNASLSEGKEIPKTEEIDLSAIFSTEMEVEAEPEREMATVQSGKVLDEEFRQKEESGNPAESGSGMSGILKSAIRQSAILERIRQTGNCRLKDIQEILPQCSERTIRYDLQALLSQNLVERIGTGGPSVYYRIRG